MKLPFMNELDTQRNIIDVFRGYNHNLRIEEGEFFDMTNLSSSRYPVLSTRPKRGVYASPTNPQGLARYDTLCYVDGANFVVNGIPVHTALHTDPNYCPKQIIRMGAYAIIMPDKKYINLTDLTDFGEIEASIYTSGTVSFEMCKVDGSAYETSVKGASAPEITEEMKSGKAIIPLWLDTSSTPHSLKQYSTSSKMWVTIGTTYVKITATGIGKPFSVGDGVTISDIEIEQLADLNNTMVIWDKGDNYIIVTGVLDEATSQENSITVSRLMPNMDFVIEAGNRLWGCRYGTALNGKVVNEIYASKLGDFRNWNCFAGISTDSYAVTVGTDGQFTGAITHLGYPLFFKENYLHKIYGNYPANFQVNTTACRGVQRGSHKSLAIVNEVLFYKSRNAVCAYDGSLPQEISYALGEVSYSEAVAGSHGNKYYISMKDDSTGFWNFFVYDVSKGLWHREDNTQVDDFCSCRGEMYYIDHIRKQIMTVNGSGTPEIGAVVWMAETGIIGTDSPDKKYISKLNVRMSIDGGYVDFYVQYDSCGEWERICGVNSNSLRTFTIPIRPKRCDHLRLRINGYGDANIFSITKTIEQGSDV